MLLFALFMTVYERQMDIRVQEEASSLAEELGRTAFSALTGGQPFKDLPPAVGGSPYAVEIRDNQVFVVRITGGRGSGSEYASVINAPIVVENGDFAPGGRMYFMRSGDRLLVSSSPIAPPAYELEVNPTGQPPEFYEFSKTNPRAATGIIASYFEISEQGYTATGYRLDGNAVVRWEKGGVTRYLSVSGHNDAQRVGNVISAWVVDSVDPGPEIPRNISENLDNVVATGWLFSPERALRDLRLRTWKAGDNLITVPSNPQITAACVTTNAGRSYPVWRIAWDDFVIYYRAIPWWENDDEPGFVMQSSPAIEPVV